MNRPDQSRTADGEPTSDDVFGAAFRRCFAMVLVAVLVLIALTGAARPVNHDEAGPVPLPRSPGTATPAEPANKSDGRTSRHDDSTGVRTGLWHATFRDQDLEQDTAKDLDQETLPDGEAASTMNGKSSGATRIAADTEVAADDSVGTDVLMATSDEQPMLASRVPSLSAIEIEDTKAAEPVEEQLPSGPSNVTVIVLLIAAILSVGLLTSG